MRPGVRLVMLGRQGAGKGTQAIRLARHYGVAHVSTGDMLRNAVKEGTEFGAKAKVIMDRGDLVPDDVMCGVVEERLAKADATERGFVLDGFPRTVPQAKALEEITLERPLDVVIDLEVPLEEVKRRLAARRVCAGCGANYSTDTPPKRHLECDRCGGAVIQRADDTPAAIQTRLDLYETETAPLVSYYQERGLLVSVDGMGPAEEVTARLVSAVEARRAGPR